MILRGFYSLALSLIVLSSCLNLKDNSGAASYQQHCAACHGVQGEGLGSYIPPLRDADYLKSNQNDLSCIIKYGMNAEIEVNGKLYSQPMGGITELDEAEITNIINYIRKEYLAQSENLRIEDIEEQLRKCD